MRKPEFAILSVPKYGADVLVLQAFIVGQRIT